MVVGGGIGAAPLYPIVQGMREAGNHVIVIIGTRTKELVILEQEMRAITDKVNICTDDGSYGRKGLVTDSLKKRCEQDLKGERIRIPFIFWMKVVSARLLFGRCWRG